MLACHPACLEARQLDNFACNENMQLHCSTRAWLSRHSTGISQGVARQSSRTEREGCAWGAAGAEEVVALPCVNMRDLGSVCPTLRTGAVYRGSQVLR